MKPEVFCNSVLGLLGKPKAFRHFARTSVLATRRAIDDKDGGSSSKVFEPSLRCTDGIAGGKPLDRQVALILLSLGSRSFLRSREVCADIVASDVVGDQAFQARISSAISQEPIRKSLSWNMLMEFSAHPSSYMRSKMVGNRPLALKPNWKELLWLGYAIGFSYFVADHILLVANVQQAELNSSTIVLSLFTTFWLTVGCLFAVRSTVSTVLLENSIRAVVVGGVLNAAITAVGIMCGVALNPLRVATVRPPSTEQSLITA